MKDKNVRLTVKDANEERNSSQQTLRASLRSCFRRNRCALDDQEAKDEPRFSFFRRRNNIMDRLRVTISKSVNVLCYFNVNCFLPLGISIERVICATRV